MRWLIVCLALGGCAHAKPVAPVRFANAPGKCWVEGVQFLVGKQGNSVLASEALSYSGARTIRWIRPKQAVTLDFREDRLNIMVDKHERVTKLTCG